MNINNQREKKLQVQIYFRQFFPKFSHYFFYFYFNKLPFKNNKNKKVREKNYSSPVSRWLLTKEVGPFVFSMFASRFNLRLSTWPSSSSSLKKFISPSSSSSSLSCELLFWFVFLIVIGAAVEFSSAPYSSSPSPHTSPSSISSSSSVTIDFRLPRLPFVSLSLFDFSVDFSSSLALLDFDFSLSNN